MAFYGVGIDAEVARLILEIKLKLANKYGAYGLRQLDLAMRHRDYQGQGVLPQDEFIQTLNDLGIFLRQIDYQALTKYFDPDRTGVKYNEFLDRFRERLSPQREEIVRSVFERLDLNHNGSLSPQEVSALYKSNQNADFVLGRKSEDQAVREFFGLFDLNRDGKIGYNEWVHYYTDVSSMTGGDHAFEELVNSCWGESTKQKTMTTDEVGHYINLIRERLVTMTKGVEDEFKLQKLYKSFDKHNSGMLSMFEFDGMLLRLNLVVPKEILPLLFKNLDKNRSGYIEFDEFCNFLLYNPYKR